MAYTQRVNWEVLRSIDSEDFDGTFQPVGDPLLFPSYILKMVNNSNVLVTISNDGITDRDVCPAHSFWLYDENKTARHEMMQKGTQIFVKGTAGVSNSGLVYVVSQYLIAG